MATNLTDIIKKVRTALRGEEVRGSIADGLEFCGQISENAKADMEATAASTKEQLSKDIDAKAAAALESIPESYTEIDKSVKQLKEDIDNLNYLQNNYFERNQSNWENGLYSDDSQQKKDSDYAVRIANPIKIPVGQYHVTNFSAGIYRIKIWVFNGKNAIIYNSGWQNKDLDFVCFESNAKYIMHIGLADGGRLNIEATNEFISRFAIQLTNEIDNQYDFKYGSVDDNGNIIYSNTRLVASITNVKYGYKYTVTTNGNYENHVKSISRDGQIYEKFEYSNTNVFDTRGVANRVYVIVRNNANDGNFDFKNIKFDFAISGKSQSYRENILESYGVTWKNASVDDDGNEISNQWSYQRALSSPIKIFPDRWYKIKVPSPYQAMFHIYDANFSYYGDQLSGAHIAWITSGSELNFGGFDGYVRLLIKNNDSTSIQQGLAPFGIVIKEILTLSTMRINGKRIRVGTHNLGHFYNGTSDGYDEDDYLEQVKNWVTHFSESNLDICGLQEFSAVFSPKYGIPSIKNIFNKVFARTVTGLLDQAVSSNLTINDISYGRLYTEDYINSRPYIILNVTKDETTFCFAIVHLHPNDSNVRAIQRKELINILKKLDVFVCVGDFNADVASEYDEFRIAGFNIANCGDYGVFETNIYSQKPLDNIITSDNVEILSVEKEGNVTSDHYMLVSELLIPEIFS